VASDVLADIEALIMTSSISRSADSVFYRCSEV
jgi:hypothetical protein